MTPETIKRANELTTAITELKQTIKQYDERITNGGSKICFAIYRAHPGSANAVHLRLSDAFSEFMAKTALLDMKEQLAELEQELREL